MIVGYARTSTAEQEAGLEAQRRILQVAGCTQVFAEQVSAVTKRDQLNTVLRLVQRGDTLVVTKPDRLARNVTDLLNVVAQLEAKGVALRILSMGGGELDTRNPTSKLMLTVLGAVAEFERALMLERQREGIAKAKQDGKYQGRAPTAQRQADKAKAMKAQGMKPMDIAAALNISRASAYRILATSEC